jgi:hypothetical protein
VKRIRAEHLVIAASFAVLIVGVLLISPDLRGAGHDPQEKKRASTHYTTPSGGKALYELLRGLGFDARRHERELGLLPADARVLFLLAPPMEKFKDEEARDLLRFVERGGTLVWAPRERHDADPVAKAFGLEVTVSALAAVPFTFESGGRRYDLSSETKLRVDGQVVVERGGLVALADARMASNRGLKEAQNAEFLVHLAARAGGAILFDEFHHGFQGGQSAFAVLMDSPLAGAIWILLAAAYLGVIAAGRRLGPPVDPRLERRRRPRESLDAFAGVCAALRAGPQAAGLVAAEFRQFLKSRPSAALPPDEIARVTARLDALAKAGRVNERDLVGAFRDVEALRARVLEQRRTP